MDDIRALELLVKLGKCEGYIQNGKAYHFNINEKQLLDTMAAQMASDIANSFSEEGENAY